MTVKQARELLGRAKLNYSRNKNIEALSLIIKVLQGMGNNPYPAEVRGSLRDVMVFVTRDNIVTEILQKQLAYQPGQEKSLLAPLTKVHNTLLGKKDEESYEDARKRKMLLDKTLNEGLRLLSQNKISEADKTFLNAISFYKDEHIVFTNIGKALFDAQQFVRAFPYLRRSAELNPNNQATLQLLERCTALREQAQDD